MAKAIAAAIPNTWRTSAPTMLAASWSSAAARIWRPSGARERKSWRPAITTTATAKTISDRWPTESCGVSWKEPEASEPEGSDWLSAENASSIAFWMTIESPKVTRRVVRGLTSRLRWMMNRWTG